MSYSNNYRKPRQPIYDSESGEPPTEKQIARMKSQARNVCIYALSKTDKTRKQLKEKLKMKRLPDEIIEETLDTLEQQGLIDDEKFARIFVTLKKDKLSERAMKNKLRERGVPSEIIDNAVEEFNDEDEHEKALELARTRKRSISRVPAAKRKQRFASFMMNRGYSWDSAAPAIEVVLAEIAEEEEEELEAAAQED